MSTDIYSMPDLTKKVRHRDGDRGQRGDTEDTGQMEERVVDIYENVDVAPEPQEDMRDNAAGRQTQGQRSKTVRWPLRVTGSLGTLCLMLLGVIIGLVVHYNSVINNLTLNRERLKTDNTNLTLERNQLKSDYTNLTLERNLLKSDYTNLTLERNQLNTSYNNVILERNQLNTSNNDLASEVNQLKAVKSCPDGWMKFGDRCYYRSTEEKTWEESRNECLKAGAYLVIINSKLEQDLIGRLNHGCEVPSKRQTWIGLKSSRSTWTWVDQSPLRTGYWGSGYPGSTKSVCAYYWQSDGLWYHSSCSDTKTWICEK